VEPNRAAPLSSRRTVSSRLGLYGAALSALELSVLLLTLGYLLPLSARAVVLAVGLWLLGEVAWLRRGRGKSQDEPDARFLRGPLLLRSFARRAVIGVVWATLLTLLCLRLHLLTEDQALVLPWLGLSVGPLLAAGHVLSLARLAGQWPAPPQLRGRLSAEPLSWFRQRLLRRAGTVVLAGLLTTAQLLLLLLVLLVLWLPKQDWSFWRAFPVAIAVGEWLWLLASIALLSSIEAPLSELPGASSFEKREAVWLKVVHRLLLLPSRLSMAHALLTYLGFLAVVLWLVSRDQLSTQQGQVLFGVVLLGESAAVLWLGLLTRRSLRPLFPPASQHLSLRALEALRPPPLSGQVLLLLSTVLLGVGLLVAPEDLPTQLLLGSVGTLTLVAAALGMSLLHRKLLGRTWVTGPQLVGDPAEQLAAWLLEAEHSTLGRALLSLRHELHERLKAAAEAQALLQHDVEQRTSELREQSRELAETLWELEQTQAALVQSEKLASVGRLIANVTHEINNPVNAVLNSGEPLAGLLADLAGQLERGPLTQNQCREALDEGAAMLKVIERGAERTREIVRSLHRYSVPDEIGSEEVDLLRCLEEAWLLCQDPRKSEVVVERELSPLPPTRGHAGQLQQVLTNLLANAVFALHERRQREPGAPQSTLRLRSAVVAEELLLEITDNGIGMSDEVRRRLFEPFFSTKDVAHGTGLGLAIAHGIIGRHHGRMVVESQPSGGSTFTIYLPTATSR